MQNTACTDSIPTNSVTQLIHGLTEIQHRELRHFAERRLTRLRNKGGPAVQVLSLTTAEDLVHQAITSILLGELDSERGRRLSAKARQDAVSLLWPLMSIMNSDLQNLVSRMEVSLRQEADQSGQDPWRDIMDPVDHELLVQRRDLQNVLFERLRQVLPQEPALGQVIDHWEKHFLESDRIAGPDFDENLVRRVRRHARRILSARLKNQIEPMFM